MGELSGINNDQQTKQDGDVVKDEEGFETDVEGVKANSFIQHGSDKFPCFDVPKDSFFQNMKDGRKRIRFKNGTPEQQYMQKSKYQRKFYIKYSDENGKAFVRTVK